MEAERRFKYSHDGHRKRKHLVAAALPNSPTFNCHCNANHQSSRSTSWPLSMLMSGALVIALTVLVSTWMFHHDNNNVGGDEVTTSIMRRLAAQIGNSIPCSGHGYAETTTTHYSEHSCKCYECFGGSECSEVVPSCVIDLDHGDPTLFEEFWFRNGAASVTVILGFQRMSYFAHSTGRGPVWFMEKELDEHIRALHALVGNAAVTRDDGRGRGPVSIVVGTGSTQLFQAALFALTSPDQPAPTPVVSAAPFYSSFPAVTDYLRSARFKWAGDAASFEPEDDGEPGYIELVTSPNNPDGKIQHAIVTKGMGHVVHDLAYFWPHYTPITAAAAHDIMLFTLSKSTGHAGTRLGWAIVKDKEVAKRMTKFLELNTIGVSQDSQVRATQIIKAVVQGYDHSDRTGTTDARKLFHFGAAVMHYRWRRLRAALNASAEFTIASFEPSFCTFFREDRDHTPAFVWLRCIQADDCEAVLKARRILTRSGRHFGAGIEFVRLSMLDRNRKFEMLVDRLAKIDSSRTPG